MIGVAVPTSPHQDVRRLRIEYERQLLISPFDTNTLLRLHLSNDHGYGSQCK